MGVCVGVLCSLTLTMGRGWSPPPEAAPARLDRASAIAAWRAWAISELLSAMESDMSSMRTSSPTIREAASMIAPAGEVVKSDSQGLVDLVAGDGTVVPVAGRLDGHPDGLDVALAHPVPGQRAEEL